MMYGMMSPKGYEITFNGYNKEDLKKVVQFLNNHDIKSFKIMMYISVDTHIIKYTTPISVGLAFNT